jgi:uncharacterized protein (DUF58 family)
VKAAGADAFLPPALLERLGGLDVVARTVVRGFVAGAHRSPSRGSGEEFARHREYQPGDDLRHLDWKVFGRTDRLYVREWEERSNLRAFLVVDASASMEYADAGGASKARYAAYLAAALAHLMLRSGDAVGLAAFGGGEMGLLVPARSRRGQLAALLRALERLRAGGSGSAAPALERVGEEMRRRGRVVLVSDLLEEDDGAALLRAVGRLRARGDEVICLRILSATEAGLRPLPAGRFFDPEAPQRSVAAAPEGDAGYRGRVEAYFGRIAAGLAERGAEYVPALTDEPVERALIRWLGPRRA